MILLKGGFEKGMLVLGDIPLCSQNPTYEMSLSFTNICKLTLNTRIFMNYIGGHHKWDMIFKGEQRAYSFPLTKIRLILTWGKYLFTILSNCFLQG